MIDFENGAFVKLGPIDPQELADELAPLLVDGEEPLLAYRGVRDAVAFTSRRIIAINAQGIAGRKRDYSSLPYRSIHAWSVETASTLDRDAELELWLGGLGAIRLEFRGQVDIRTIGRLIGDHVLG